MGTEYYVVEPEWLVDTLIENEIGDISEWKEKYAKLEKSDTSKEDCTIEQHEEIHYLRDKLKQTQKESDEWKARAEVAERALKNVIKQYKRCDELGACEECFERQGCVKALCDKYKQQAEKEIEEERK